MFRSIFGFAVFAALAFVALNIFFGILGGLFGLALWILKLAAIGFVLYFVLRLISPSTADKIRDMDQGSPPRRRVAALVEFRITAPRVTVSGSRGGR